MPSQSRDSASSVDRPERLDGLARLQRSLAYFSLTLIGLSVVAIIAIMVMGGAGVKNPSHAQILIELFPEIALPLGALGIIAIFVVNAVERRKLNGRQAK